jgi:hypothetical protein
MLVDRPCICLGYKRVGPLQEMENSRGVDNIDGLPILDVAAEICVLTADMAPGVFNASFSDIDRIRCGYTELCHTASRSEGQNSCNGAK